MDEKTARVKGDKMTMVKRWKIESAAGVEMGVYEGETEQDALDAMARDAGYQDLSHADEVTGSPFRGTVTR